MVKKNQSGANSAQNADLSVENLQETENRATFAQRPARTEEEMLRRKEGDRKYVNPMSDYGFKAVFGLENVMKTFLNDLLLPTSPIVEITFLDKEMLPQNDEERGVVYDLRCKTEDGTEFIVEMQNQSQKYFSDRIVFYLSRSIAPQGIKGTENGQQWDYKLEPVYGVFFLNFQLGHLEPKMLRTIQFSVKETQEVFSDKVRAYTIELPCFKDKTEEDCTTNLERWIYNLIIMNSTTKPLAFQDIMPVFKEVASAAELASMSEEEYRRYMNSLDRYRTAVACYDYAYEEGMAKGMADGMAKGRAEERAEATRDHAIAMKKNGASNDFIVKCLNMTIEEVVALPTE